MSFSIPLLCISEFLILYGLLVLFKGEKKPNQPAAKTWLWNQMGVGMGFAIHRK